MDSKTEANNTNRFRTMKKKDTTSKSDTTNKFDITKFDINNKSDIYDTSKVKELQSFLKAMDYYSGEVDGILGPHTKAALNAFQDIKMGTPIKKEYNLKIK